MEIKKTYFKERQFFYISIIPALIILGMLSIFYFLEIGDENKKITLPAYLFGISIFLFIILITYDLKIKIDIKYIYLTFGIGIISKKILIKDIDLKKIDIIDIPWYYGLGMRFSDKGLVFNTILGKGIRIELKSNQKKYIIVSKKIDEIEKTLMDIHSLASDKINL